MVHIYQHVARPALAPLAYHIVAVYLAQIAFSTVILWRLNQDLTWHIFDRLAQLQAASYIISWLLVAWQYPEQYRIHFDLALVLFGIILIGFPVAQRDRLVFGLTLFACNLLILARLTFTPDIFGQALALFIIALGAIIVSTRLYTYRRLHFRSEQALRQAVRENERLVLRDPLTGVYNRSTFLQQADLEFARSRRYNRPLSLLILDIDQFRQMNEAYGHLTGDYILTHFAQVIQKNKRRQDILARLGSEEFGLLLPETPLSAARWVAQRMISLCNMLNLNADEQPIPISVSIGGAELCPEDPDFETLLRRADRTLNQARQSGRGQIAL
jgi:diguanylate cyclase (GGDEF)-like protein